MSGGSDGRVLVFSTKPDAAADNSVHDGSVESLLIGSTGHVISTASNGTIAAHSLDTGEGRRLTRHAWRIPDGCLALFGDYVISGGPEGQVHASSLSQETVRRLAEHQSAVSALLITAEGRVVSGGEDGLVHVVGVDGSGPAELTRSND